MGALIQFRTSMPDDPIEATVRMALRLAGANAAAANWIWNEFAKRVCNVESAATSPECAAADVSRGWHLAALSELLAIEAELFHAKFGGAPLDRSKLTLQFAQPVDLAKLRRSVVCSLDPDIRGY
jgi:hypothetical protein